MMNRVFFVLSMTFLLFVVVVLDIPILRQIICFVFLLLPGFFLLSILKLKKLNLVDRILLAIGLSITLLMFIGFIMNALGPLFDVLAPLSTTSLMLTLSIVTVTLSILDYSINKKSRSLIIPIRNLSPKVFFLICIPVLAAFGAWFNNSHLLLVMILIIVLLICFAIFSKTLIPTELYPLLVVVIAVSLLFHMSLISRYLTGWDLFPEQYIFKLTKVASYWDPHISLNNLQLSTYNAMLSLTVLPTIFSNLLNITEEFIFKIVYALIFSLVPLTLFRTWKQFTGEHTALLSAFFFMFSSHFYASTEMRQPIAELFFALLIFLILNKKINPQKRQILLVTFGAALVVSHYSRMYLLLFTVFFVWFIPFLIRSAKTKSRTINFSLLLLFFTLTFAWYTYVSTAPTDVLSQFINNIASSLSTDFLNFQYRGADVSVFMDPLSASSPIHLFDNLFSKITYVFILIGCFMFFIFRTKYEEMKFDWEYATMAMANSIILSAVVLVPHVGPGFVGSRFFHVSLFFLAPLCIVGGKTSFKWLQEFFSIVRKKSKPKKNNIPLSLVCVVLVLIFLLKIGFVYEVAGDVPSSISLSNSRMKMSSNIEIRSIFYDFYVPEQDVFSAEWMSSVIREDSIIYADYISKMKVLVGYGMINLDRVASLNNDTNVEVGGYIYLRYQNVIDGRLRYLMYNTETTETLDIDEVSYIMNNVNKIYSNGFSEVYQSYKYLNITAEELS